MEGFRPEESFRGEVAKTYDDEPRGDEAETVAFLKAQAAGRDCLELAIGTGRVALPLAAQGIRVDGIELSPDMIDVLRNKHGGGDLTVIEGDMTTVGTGRLYGLVYLVFNSIGNVLTQDGQVKCFENAAKHLNDGGVFVLECRVPTAACRGDAGFVDVYSIKPDVVHLGACKYDPITQVLDIAHIHLSNAGVKMEPISLRLANPAEFDLMARYAGLKLDARYGGWQHEPFDVRSWRHISVYRKQQS